MHNKLIILTRHQIYCLDGNEILQERSCHATACPRIFSRVLGLLTSLFECLEKQINTVVLFSWKYARSNSAVFILPMGWVSSTRHIKGDFGDELPLLGVVQDLWNMFWYNVDFRAHWNWTANASTEKCSRRTGQWRFTENNGLKRLLFPAFDS